MWQSNPVRHAMLNLHSAEAALVTARQRLSDAEARYADDVGCSPGFASMLAPADIGAALQWWHQQVEQVERAVEDRKADLTRAPESGRIGLC